MSKHAGVVRLDAVPAALLAAVNSGERLLRALGVPLDRFSEERFLDAARRKTGLSDFGDEHFREPFAVWLESLQKERHFSGLGRLAARWQTASALRNRLLLRAALADRPEILDAAVRRPIVIASLHRTGTTLLHKLLSQDPAARPLRAWETRNPVPSPRDRGKDPDPRVLRARRVTKLVRRVAPGLRALHNFDLEGPEECGLLLRNTFVTAMDGLFFARYREWYQRQSQQRLAVAYREYREQLQFLQWERPVPPDGHWVLKSPLHIFALEALLSVLPDASVVLIHRDPRESIPSACSILGYFFDLGFEYDDDHRRWLMESVVGWFSEGVRRSELARTESTRARICDVDYRRLVLDPIGTTRQIYDYFGYRYSREVEAAARDWIEDNPPNKFGKHSYSLDRFGLTEQMLEDAFGDYYKRHAIEPSAAR
jgi:hypothetical protein